jgi:general secretion pathway protein G
VKIRRGAVGGVQEVSRPAGFTLLEALVVAGLVGTLLMVVVPPFFGHTERMRVLEAQADILEIHVTISEHMMNNIVPPDSLTEVGHGMRRDPWGKHYQYLRILENNAPGVNGKRRKDHSLVPVNSDYDLYSMGPDGKSRPPFTARQSRDDIVRAANGGFIGPVSEF